MIEQYRDADAIITIQGKEYALYKKGPLKKYPYIVDISTGKIPHGAQRAILKPYLLQNGINIEPWEEHGPHWCVRQAIKAAQGVNPLQLTASNTFQQPLRKVRPAIKKNICLLQSR